MTEESSPIVLEQLDDGFRLRAKNTSGETREILLSDSSVLTLAQLATNLQQQILAKKSLGQGIGVAFSTKVSRAAVHLNILGDAILLTLGSPSGNQTTFDFQPPEARQLATMILETLAQMKSSTAIRQ
jgi:hypothetical protein